MLFCIVQVGLPDLCCHCWEMYFVAICSNMSVAGFSDENLVLTSRYCWILNCCGQRQFACRQRKQTEFKNIILVQRFHFHFPTADRSCLFHLFFHSVSISRLSTYAPVYVYTLHAFVCSVLIPVAVGLFSAPLQHHF